MHVPIILDYRDLTDLLDTLLPDFVLAFAFFAALIYSVLGRRMGQQRPAIMVSAALGAALASGLVWWEQVNNLSIRNLGPIAVGFAIILLGGIIHQSIRHVGGNWAGAGIAIGACLLVGWTLGIDWPVDREVIQSVTTATLTIGVLAFLLHRRSVGERIARWGSRGAPELDDVRHDMRDLHEDRGVADRLLTGFRNLRRKADTLNEHPRDAADIRLQLRRMLPAEGWLTERMARLRERAHHVRVGHVARIEEIQSQLAKLSPIERRTVASELSAHYKKLKLDLRIERLDKTVAACEMRIRQLTQQAESCLANHDHRELVAILDEATKLQHHNAKLLKAINRTETHLARVTKHIAHKPSGVKPA